MKIVGLSSLIDLSGWKEKKSKPKGDVLIEYKKYDGTEYLLNIPMTADFIRTLIEKGSEFLAAEEAFKKEQDNRLIHMVDTATKSWGGMKNNICIDKLDKTIVMANMCEHIKHLVKITAEYCGEVPDSFFEGLYDQEEE